MIGNQKQLKSTKSQKPQENMSKLIKITFERSMVLQKYCISPYKHLFIKCVSRHSPTTLEKPKNKS